MTNFAYMSGTGNDFIVGQYEGEVSEIQIIALVSDAEYEVDGSSGSSGTSGVSGSSGSSGTAGADGSSGSSGTSGVSEPEVKKRA